MAADSPKTSSVYTTLSSTRKWAEWGCLIMRSSTQYATHVLVRKKKKKKKRLGHTVQRFRWMNKGTCTYTHFQLNKLYRSRSLLSWDDRHTTIRCNNWRTGEGRSAYGDSRIACSVKWRQRVNRTIEWVTIPQWPLFESVHTTWSSTIQRARCCRRAQWEKTRISVCTLRGTQKKDTIFVRT